MRNLISRTPAMAIVALCLLFASPTTTNNFGQATAQVASAPNVSQTSVQEKNVMVVSVVAKKDDRAKRLGAYLLSVGSPMAADAESLVKIADSYDLDWTLLPAIAGLESQYGKMVPAGSYNPYGWDNGRMNFKSWSDASETVAAGIRIRYQPTGIVTPWDIGSRYAASPTWAVRVTKNQSIINQF